MTSTFQVRRTNRRGSAIIEFVFVAIRLTPPRELTLESAIEFIGADELVEVTPK